MNESIIEVFINRIKNLVLTDEKMTVIPLAYLMTLDLPESIKHFFDQEVELWIREEEEKFTSNDRFDYDMPEVRMLIDQLFDQLKQNASFHISKFNQLLERAIKLEMNYLIEPHRTLSQFLFKDSSKISTMEVYDTLKYFTRYSYYKTAISDYFNTKYLREISQDQFEDLINQIDEKVFAEDTVETVLKTLKVIMDFQSEIQEENITSLSVEILYSAFRDRNLTDYLELINEVKDKTELSELTFEEIEALLKDSAIPGLVEERPEKEPTETIALDTLQNIEESKPEISVEDIEVKETELVEEIEEEEEEEELEEEIEEADEEVEVEKADISDIEPKKTNVANDLADYVASQISSDEPLEDLHDIFKGRLRRKTLKKLFNKNEEEYNNFLDRLNSLSSWKDASQLIDDEFYNRAINPYSKEAILFSDNVYLRFFPKDKYVGSEYDSDRF